MCYSYPSAPHNVFTLAKQDEIRAIVTLLNHALNPKGITARVGWNHDCLGILVEAVPIPDQAEMVALIRECLATLNLEAIKLVKVCGYQPGHSLPAWYEEIELDDVSAPVPYSAPSLTSWLNQGLLIDGQNTDRDASCILPAQPAAQWVESLATESLATTHHHPNAADVRFLRFYFNAKETALLPLHSIQEVLKVPVAEILPVPQMPDCILGIYKWRGEMLWLVDLPYQLGFELTQTDRCSSGALPAIVIQSDRKFLGLVVPQISDIETLSLQKLQPSPSAFPTPLLSMMQGYFPSSNSPVLDANALIQDPQLQVHSHC